MHPSGTGDGTKSGQQLGGHCNEGAQAGGADGVASPVSSPTTSPQSVTTNGRNAVSANGDPDVPPSSSSAPTSHRALAAALDEDRSLWPSVSTLAQELVSVLQQVCAVADSSRSSMEG